MLDFPGFVVLFRVKKPVPDQDLKSIAFIQKYEASFFPGKASVEYVVKLEISLVTVDDFFFPEDSELFLKPKYDQLNSLFLHKQQL